MCNKVRNKTFNFYLIALSRQKHVFGKENCRKSVASVDDEYSNPRYCLFESSTPVEVQP